MVVSWPLFRAASQESGLSGLETGARPDEAVARFETGSASGHRTRAVRPRSESTGGTGERAIEALLRGSIGGMRPNRSIPTATVIPVLIYLDVREAVAWLCAAFGFVERVRIGQNHRAQLRFGDGAVIVGDVRGDRRPPRGDEVTHSVMVRVDDVRAHCERARENGARILMEPTDFEYGERQYSAADPAGHQWTFL